mmetsp:Transcript_57243/g.165892  ORF Transcript_57243/g.165892 Transcript_57243/m.165892 type:complete len:191 (-) Transcript_57243:31-603(-)
MQEFAIRFLGRDISSATALSWALIMFSIGGLVIVSQPNFDEPMARIVGALAGWLCISAVMCMARLLRWQAAFAAAAASPVVPKRRLPVEAEVRKAFEHRCPAATISGSGDGEKDEERAVAKNICLGSMCVICMERFKEGERFRKPPCGHCFHAKCIDAWWVYEGRRGATKLRCPTCRACVCELQLGPEEV